MTTKLYARRNNNIDSTRDDDGDGAMSRIRGFAYIIINLSTRECISCLRTYTIRVRLARGDRSSLRCTTVCTQHAYIYFSTERERIKDDEVDKSGFRWFAGKLNT